MHVTFHGAVREVTGSMHLIGTDHDHVLLDCGLHQGRRKEAAEKNRVLPFDADLVTNMVLSHAHIDHSGRIPLLVKGGFRGRVVCTRGTASICNYLLADSARIQEQDADYLNYKTVRGALSQGPTINGKPIGPRKYEQLKKMLKKGRSELNRETIQQLMARYHLERVDPLYTTADAENALGLMEGVPYRTPVTIGKNMTCTFYEAGHILGSAITILRYTEGGRTRTIGYTGDLGRFDKPIVRNPCLDFAEEDRHIDLLIMESTYGDRDHEPTQQLKPHLKQALNETFDRGGCVLIPAFAFGRTQELLYVIHELYNEGAVPRKPVFVDSPLATRITSVFGEHPETYDRDTHATFLSKGKNPFDFPQVHFTQSVEESMALMRQTKPHIVISASGMCEAGRILHHLRNKIHNPIHTILLVGFMAQHTLGRRILEQGQVYEAAGRTGDPPIVRILNKEYPLKARVVKLNGFSAHADRNEMIQFLKDANLDIKRIAVVHGEESQSLAFAELLREKGYNARVPREGQTFELE
ncbi:MBL fold metallo-hydrolase RNA specificity domain-containing protein [Desulfatitalea alkaliphila]|uniref:MBL fold metallo-hydrolase n=1 Tax=Desulfatitalea alkaliphila TaxID=2929485 RepID=A0AA41R1E1_9BACT|nr:MBL fold metallo-hydrolase [Desulfatitalea alkaliphila]MCJ8499435.1 MBL fold metallo-hydrolase [Desulfatitalea alkaliphila]